MSGETIDGAGPFEFDKPIEIEGDVNYRSAETGQYVSEEEAEAHPETTVKESEPLVTEVQGVNPRGSKNKLNKRSLIMNLHDNDGVDGAFFVHIDEGELTDAMHMPLELWDDMGRPDTITVVVYPKDMLN